MQQDAPPGRGLGLAGPCVPKIPKKFHQIAQNKREKFVKKIFLGKFGQNFYVPIFLVVKFYLVNYEYCFLVVSILLVDQLGVLTLLKTNTHS
jgi:hypothetical protein